MIREIKKSIFVTYSMENNFKPLNNNFPGERKSSLEKKASRDKLIQKVEDYLRKRNRDSYKKKWRLLKKEIEIIKKRKRDFY